MQTAICVALLAAAISIVFMPVASATEPDCNRECLRGFMGAGAEADKQSLIVWEFFKIYGGEIHAVEAFMLGMFRGTPSGWDTK
jgi:hypothetical protein